MFSLSGVTPNFIDSTAHIIEVSRSDRWRIYSRLQELMIPCWCLQDGTLRVDIQSSISAVLLRSVIQQFAASRQELVNWLETCLDAD